MGPATPPLTLPDDEGTIQLGQFRGRSSSSISGRRRALHASMGPALQRRAHQWAEEGLPVQVLSVNTMEQNAEGVVVQGT